MTTVKCPRCGSKRTRHGYTPTPIWQKIFFFRNMLCNSCNWEFKTFTLTGTKTSKTGTRRRRVSKAAPISTANGNGNGNGNHTANDSAQLHTVDATVQIEATPVEEKKKLTLGKGATSDKIALKKKAKVKNRVRVKLHQKI